MDERHFRNVLHSALALSLATPAAGVACNAALRLPTAATIGADASDEDVAVTTGQVSSHDAATPAIDCTSARLRKRVSTARELLEARLLPHPAGAVALTSALDTLSAVA